MKRLVYLIILVGAFLLPGGCKTTEANYRQAYEKAIAGRDEVMDIDSTIYGRVRRQMTEQTVTGRDGKKIVVKSQLVKVTPDGGGIPEKLREYNVVVGQFKQLFNAKSLRERLVDNGYPETFVVQTAEPYYYVVLISRADVNQASDALADFEKAKVIPMKSPCPFILNATKRR